jgi:hypothetical protein
MLNEQAIADYRKVVTGKDGQLFIVAPSGRNIFMGEVDTYHLTVNVSNVGWQPVGSILEFGIGTGVTVNLSFTETVYTPTKPGQPRKPIETDSALSRSYVIYAATVDEDRDKVWDNKKALDKLGLLQGVDMIDRVLLAGEKARVLDKIDEISGFNEMEFEDAAGK